MADVLTTLANLKARLQMNPAADTALDADLTALIAGTSADFVNGTNRKSFFTASYTERRDGQGGPIMTLSNTPVQSITSLTINNQSISASADGVQNGYVNDSSAIMLIGYLFWRGYGNIFVTYSAGYGADINDAAFPPEIQLAVLDWCELRYRVRKAAGTSSVHMATGETINYDKRRLPQTTEKVMEQYKRRMPAR